MADAAHPAAEAPQGPPAAHPSTAARPSRFGFVQNWSVRTRLFAAFGAVLALLAALVLVALLAVGSMSGKADALGGMLPKTEGGEALAKAISEMQLQQELYVRAIGLREEGARSDQGEWRKAFLVTEKDVKDLVASYGAQKLDAGELGNFGAVKDGFAKLVELDAQMWPLYRSGRPADLARAQAIMVENDKIAAQLVQDARAIVQNVHSDGRDVTAAASSTASSSRMTILVLGIVAFALAGLLAFLITRSIVKPLLALRAAAERAAEGDLTIRVGNAAGDEVGEVSRSFDGMLAGFRDIVGKVVDAAMTQTRAAKEMADASEQSGLAVAQIAATVEDIARGASEQAEGTQRVTMTSEEMVRGVAQVAHGGQAAAAAATQADEVATHGGVVVGEATEAIGRVAERVEDAAGVVGGLGEKSEAIGAIVGTIDQIASQTNLLALNAAIEAARAGEQGRGFAVVAEEVRQLAEESQKAAASIGEIIREIQHETHRAVEAMDAGRSEVATGVESVGRAGEAFQAIRERVDLVAGEVSQVAAAAQQLEAGAGEVQEQIAAVAAVSQENAAAAEEVSASTEQTSASTQQVSATAAKLAGDAQSLAGLVSHFTV